MSDFGDPRMTVQALSPTDAEWDGPLGLWPHRARFRSRPRGDPEGPFCRVKVHRDGEWSRRPLEVVGLLTSYDSRFLKALSGSIWSEEDLEAFGVCPTDVPRGLLASLQRVGAHLDDPGENRLLWLHLEEGRCPFAFASALSLYYVKWEAETKLLFQLTFQEHAGGFLRSLQLALLIFYQGVKESGGVGTPEKFLVAGDGLHPKQVVCLSRRTRYLVLQGSAMSGRHSLGQLSFEVSLAIRRQSSNGTGLSQHETQTSLFGFDPKCFTRMTPAVLLLARLRPRVAQSFFPPHLSLADDGKLDMVTYLNHSGSPTLATADVQPAQANATSAHPAPSSTGRFLAALSQFVNRVLSPSGEPPPAPGPQLRLNFDTMEALPHRVLNLSEKVALERLVQSEDPLVVLFPENSQALMESHLAHWALEGKLLRQLLQKMREVIRELAASPSFRDHETLFHGLLAFCYYPPGVPGGGDPEESADGSRGRRKIHSLLLLKALQALRARWRGSRKAAPRANRSTQERDDYCRLRKLRIELVSTGYIIFPEWYDANNCAGPCRFPLSSRVPDYYSHTLFLLRVQEQGLPLERAPCCIPVRYSRSIIVTFTNDQGMKVKAYPDMVAEECGCR
ncbi:LOW QUALITY PROTEIN: muellerian-inhibiting factor [Lacerta agilis]|uniref:LOW QUALITY PROTEIN: muellerian-inhibiting factor n=1 Tax=Lacerta agilis TaxID=80427 RepID=UPI00141A30EF|nr:LOW QUALITY PROTEIN: muellerian-inhibiting factor [Lacerta agilis]